MKNSWRIKLAALSCALGLASSGLAAERLLAQTELELEQGRATAQLWGDELNNGYAQNLLVLLKDSRGRLLTAYAPSIKGGYSALLEAVQVKPIGTEAEVAALLEARRQAKLPEQAGKGVTNAEAKGADANDKEVNNAQEGQAEEQAVKSAPADEAAKSTAAQAQNANKPEPIAMKAQHGRYAQQLLVAVAQGDWLAPSEYRVLDFANSSQVVELFSAVDSMGLVSAAAAKEGRLEVLLKDGQRNEASLPAGVEARRLRYGGLFSLTPHDVDGDGQQELLGAQQLLSEQRSVADVGAVWQLDKELRWKHSAITIMTNTPTPKNNTVNDGREVSSGRILPRKIVVPGGEATYPVFVSRDVELQSKVNEALAKENEPYLKEFYQGRADMAFNVLAADERLLSLQLISGKNKFVHHYVNIEPATGKILKLEQVLNYKKKGLMDRLRELCQNKQMMLEYQPPAEWYLQGDKLYLAQHICGQNEVAAFALTDLQDFLLDKKWLSHG